MGATIITLDSLIFQENTLSVNFNTQKKSAMSVSIDNSISEMTITNCTFNNYPPHSFLGDLYLNVNSV